MTAKHHWFRCPLMVMPANNSSAVVHYWAGRYRRRIGWLVGPSAMPKTKLRPWMPFALDNDAFSAWTQQKPWKVEPWLEMLRRVKTSGLKPRWVLVPDVVADREATLRNWITYAPIAAQFGWPLAIAVQDGMTPADLPPDCLVFVGGTTEWKWRSLPTWTATGRRVHVGRVNEIEKLFVCERLGVESVDGTGWMRESETGKKARQLEAWMCGELLEHPQLI
jgi:hypothetical protein